MKVLIDCRYMSIGRFKKEKGPLPEHSLFFILTGKIDFSIEGVRGSAGENTLLSFPRETYFERKITEHAVFYYFRYKEPDGNAVPSGQIPIKNASRMKSTADMLLALEGMAESQDLKNALLNDLFTQVEAEKFLSRRLTDPTVATVHSFFEKHLSQKITIAMLAQKAELSPSGLIHHFKKCTGQSPIAYLLKMRLAKAKELLSTTSLPILKISAKCGFENPYYFSNAFKASFGMSPKDYRNLHGV